MYYTSFLNIPATPSNKLVLFCLLCVSVVLMISPEVFTIYVAIVTIKMAMLPMRLQTPYPSLSA